MAPRQVSSCALGLLGIVIAALTLSSCQYADDGARLFRSAITESAPLVKSLALRPDDAVLARSAAQYLSGVDQSVLSRARELAQDEDVQSVVELSCNLSGLANADPDEVVSALGYAADQSAQQSSLQLLFNDAVATEENVRAETGDEGFMTNAAALAVAVFQEVYC